MPMGGALLVVFAIGLTVGLVGRFVLPSRHGLVEVIRRKPSGLFAALWRDVEMRWEMGAGVLGSLGGYVLGRFADAQTGFGATTARWALAVAGAVVMVGISIASEVIERGRFTRRVEARR